MRAATDRRPRLDVYVSHAERYETQLVYETAAADGFPAVELRHLARHLGRVDRRWRIREAKRLALAERLVAAGVKSREVVEMAGVSYSTVAGLRVESASAAGLGLTDAVPQPTQPSGLVSTETAVSAPEPRYADPRAQMALFADRAEASTH
jgi:hypothetical protein